MQNQTIRMWAEDDRPREKMLLKGERALSNAELIAILISSGSHQESAVELSMRILKHKDHDLSSLAKMSIRELMQFKGIGSAKAITIKAALELGKRRQLSVAEKKRSITSSLDAFELIAPFIQDKKTEEFWIMILNRSNQVMDTRMISSGGISHTTVDPKVLFKMILEHLGSSVILVHNHPSGNLKPSQTDLDLTRRMIQAGQLLDINVLDHLIITDHGYFSFKDAGEI
jgi:DNA repair protein RadC